MSDPKFIPRSQAAVHLGQEISEGHKCEKGYSFNCNNKWYSGKIIYSTNVWADPTFSPFITREEEITSFLSGRAFISGKEQLDQKLPRPPGIAQCINIADMQNDFSALDDQQELDAPAKSEMDVATDKTPLYEKKLKDTMKFRNSMLSNQQDKQVMLIPASYFKSCRVEREYLLRTLRILFQSSQSHSKTPKTWSLFIKEENATSMYVCITESVLFNPW